MTEQFHRYDGAPEEDNDLRMPSDILDARVSNLCIGELLGRLEDFTNPAKSERHMYPWASRFVMGFPLPSWQRPLVWTDEQKIRFIESIWSGVDVGSYMVNDQYQFIKQKNGEIYREFSEVLLDGQQRLSALEDYLMNRFAITDRTGTPRFWRELPKIERRRFTGFHFARANIKSWDEAQLRMAYDLRSFGGTAHTADQQASVPTALHAIQAGARCSTWTFDLKEYAVFADKFLAEQAGMIEDECFNEWDVENTGQKPEYFYLVKLHAPLV